MPRLLLIKTSSLGDVVHNLPILADIRTHYPDMRFDWVVEESFVDIPALHPAVDQVLPVAIRRWRRDLFSAATWREIATFRRQLRASCYDLVLDSQGLLKSALIALLARGEKHGYDRRSIREPVASLFYGHRHAVSRTLHAVTRNRLLAATALGYPPPSTAPDYGIRAPQQPLPLELPARYVVALHASSRDSKLWPKEHWVELGRTLAATGSPLVLPWGNARERDRAEAIAAQVPHALVLPRLRLAQLATLLSGAWAVVGVDTGLVHLAAALGVPTVALYTDTDPQRTGVLPGRAQSAINLGSIGQIPSPATVLEALDRLTQRSANSPAQ
ncbi:lipopolysaccharide heptosyltransferase I [Tepidiphilus olei]|uniref:lipopolysaccharide heptosyltransferase I n=1 Tax=Tepidiphilus olei TaxID=2502184 RepID=UPI00115D6C80|nr:lipopolysaccharide heptosyltransferase I [Tepidiphilus olei]